MTKRGKERPAYRWEDDRGVVAIGKNSDCQAIQLLDGPASLPFRRKCGLLLVDALNKEAALAKRGKERAVPVCEQCDEEMYRYEDSPDTNKGGYYCPGCGWSQDDEPRLAKRKKAGR